MKVEFHIPKTVLERAVRRYKSLPAPVDDQLGLDFIELMTTLEAVLLLENKK